MKIKRKIKLLILAIIIIFCAYFFYIYYRAPFVSFDYCVIANGGKELDKNRECVIKEVTEKSTTVVISIKEGTPYVGKFIIDNHTHKIIERKEAF